MQRFLTSFSTHFGRSTVLLLTLLLPLLGWGQTVIGTQDFETTPATPTVSVAVAGGAYYTGSSTSSDRPASTPFNSTTGGSRSYGVSNASATITSAIVDASAYSTASVGFRLASFSIASTGNGSDQTDVVTLAISTDGGTSYSNEVIVAGGATSSVSNTIWSFASGTGIATRAYLGNNTPTTSGPAGGGARTSDGYGVVSVTGIPATNQLRFRITILNNSSSERWLVDDVIVQGYTTTSTASIGTPTYLAGARCTTSSANVGVSFTTTGTFNTGNVFTIELSGPNGVFGSTPYATATYAGTTAPTAPVPVPIAAGTFSGANYRFRVLSSNPATTSATSADFIIVNDPQVTIDPPITQTYVTGVPAVPFRAIESFTVGTTRQWQLGTSAAGPFTSIPGETGTTFTPTFSTPGTYYVNVVSTFAACGSVTSDNVAEVIVTAPPTTTLTTGTISPTSYCVGSTGAAVSVPFTSTGTFSGNTYTAYLGSGTSTPIGTLVSDANSGTIAATLPATLASGTTYRIHVEASSPATVASDNGTNLAVTNYATNNVTAFTATAGNTEATLSWTNPTSCYSRTVVVASTGPITVVPTGNPTAGSAFGTASTDLGGGQFVVYNGTGTSVVVTGLTNGTSYNFKAFVTNGDGYSTGVSAAATPVVPSPVISGFTPNNGPVGTGITISGTNLGGITGVTVGGTAATGVSATATTVTATVAAGSTTGAVVLSDGTSTYTAPGTFTVTAGLSAPTVASTIACPGVPFDVTFTASGPYTAGSTFTVQRSSSAGSFSSPVTIGTGTYSATPTQTVSATFASTLTAGTGYLIRVVSASPVATSPASVAITVSGVGIAPTTAQNIVTNANGNALTATENTPATSRQWAVGTASAGPFTDIAGQTAATYTPNFPTVGTYYVVVKSTVACGVVTSNTVRVNVTAPVLTLTSDQSSLDGFTTSSGIASTEQSYTLTAANLTVPVTVTAPTGYEVSLTTGTGFTTQVSAPASGNTTVYVRIAGSAVAGPANGTITNVSGTKSVDVGVTGTVYPAGSSACINEGFNSIGSGATAPAGWTFTGVSSYTSSGSAGTAIPAVKFDDTSDRVLTPVVANPVQLTFTMFGNATNATSSMLVEGLEGATYKTIATISNLPTTKAIQNYTFTSAPGATFANFTRFRFTYTKSAGNVTFDDVLVLCGQAAPEIDITQAGTSVASGSTVAFGNAPIGNATPDVTFLINNLGNASLTVSTVALSNNASSAFSFVTPPATPATVVAGANTPVVVRYTPTAAGPQTATLTVTNTDSNEGTYTITLTGVGLAPEPTAPQPTVTVANITTTTVDVTVAGGTGTKRLVVIRPTTTTAVVPTDGTTYTASLAYGSAAATSRTGLNNFVIIADATTGPVTVTGLTGASNYTIDVYAYNDSNVAGAENYLTATPGTAAFSTPAPPIGATQAGMLLLEDDFNGTPGSLLTANGWTAHNGAGASPITIEAGNQSFAEYPAGQPANNNRALSAGSGEDVNRAFTTPAGTSTLYVSGIINVDVDGTDYFLHLMDNTQTSITVFRGRVFTRSVAGGFKFGLTVSDGSSAAAVYAPAVYNVGQDYLVVLKYVTNAGGNDEASLYVFDAAAPATEPATPTVGPVIEANTIAANSLNAVALRQTSNSPVYYLDGLRVATGWGSVIGKPIFTSPAATLATGNYYNVAVNNADQVTPVGAVRIENNLALTSGKVNTSAINSLTLYQSASVSGGSATSFVNGPLARTTGTGAASSFFPIGKGTAYRPLTLTAAAQAAPSTYTAEQFEGNPGQSASTLGGQLKRVSTRRSYTVTSSNTTAGNFSGSITLSFGPDDYVNTPSSTDLVIAKRDGGTAGTWNSVGRATTNATTGDPDSGAGGAGVSGTLTSDTFSDFSDFAIGALNDLTNTNTFAAINPLPVELTTFSAQRESNKSVAIQWATASEKNSARFEVQRSLNARDFVTVATTKAQGSSNRTTAYAALDAMAPATQLYYRLRQVDQDGTVAYSPVATVAGTSAATKALLYPNPARSSITFTTEAVTSYRVLNQLGQALLQGPTEVGTTNVAIGQLPTGLYLLELQTATGRSVQKFEKE
ncbi:T9SS type A sorting domain-containing protein [Hymenobacter negativus]|uniref:T9SS type A sorting domain-containing protein n=1 Tax=Hymenobacter negativus TaxID=2795026 RepID=A0ABS3QCL9_9BACT|nr:T9SS type A sorting domain-containing protein [Hymenobacter negativus]MBO2008990.1 T9SS type A sorting domain-containing protein [Hymenobacter negativus]